MAFLNPGVLEAARVVVRQAAETTLATVSSAVLASASPSPATADTSIANTPPPSLITSVAPGASATNTNTLVNGGANPGNAGENSGGNDGGGGGGGGNSSSLLFFVALGFGVVFTNLWIIVGVKYCFRYNARNRALRNEEGDPINMENMPRPHRRRREKKLMPIDEVNEKFPMLKYKTWVASRAQEGLPTRGGVSAPTSRPNSIRDADGVIPGVPSKERMSTDDRPTTSATATKAAAEPAPDAVPSTEEKPQAQSPRHVPKESTSSTVGALRRASTESHREPDSAVAHKHMSQISQDEDDDDEHIDAALPPECMGTSGDTCAICIDSLENDDDVRGLTCGHAFHAVCIDPWLTTRRACCPLCKADYYTPKPRPQPTEGGDGTTGPAPMSLREMHATSPRVRRHVRPPFFSFGGPRGANRNARHPAGTPRTREDGASSVPGRQRIRTALAPAPPPATGTAGSGGMLSGLRNAYLGFRVGRRHNNNAQSDPVASRANPATTPSQLEAGVRNPQS